MLDLDGEDLQHGTLLERAAAGLLALAGWRRVRA